MKLMHSCQCRENLLGNELKSREGEIGWVLFIDIVEILFEQLCEYHQMLPMIKEVVHVDDTGLIWITVSFDISQQLNLVQRLIHVVFVVENHLQTVFLLLGRGSQILDLDSL